MKTTITMQIENIKVSKDGYYSFKWFALVNGKKKKGEYDSSYSSRSASAMRSLLKRGYAIELAVSQLFGF